MVRHLTIISLELCVGREKVPKLSLKIRGGFSPKIRDFFFFFLIVLLVVVVLEPRRGEPLTSGPMEPRLAPWPSPEWTPGPFLERTSWTLLVRPSRTTLERFPWTTLERFPWPPAVWSPWPSTEPSRMKIPAGLAPRTEGRSGRAS